MKNAVLHKANERGHADHGWLNAYHSFSFANWYNPDKVQFGVLRVLNDDTVAPGMGFGMHPHDNMEIITIPLEGDLAHKDSMGNAETIKFGDVQVMSAGTGIRHSEFNPNADRRTKLLQIWLFPNKRNVTPRYQQITLNVNDRHNKLQQILSPKPEDEGVWIHQEAWFNMGKLDKGFTTEYNVKRKENGVYAFVISGKVTINGYALDTKDALGVWDTEKLDIQVDENAELLLMDIPME
ncbi:pirin family protein [Flavobacterium piscinae]|uniref:Pirin family protein n=1 Tax=Flavobacterium piscinae TaxID=2506424 RepID=A0A4Q1KJ75_9FLAO|nr:pirin family protein [Flavobacterium piscinae]MBC8883435.1 pirin family protein [Flavobacterium piscinae]RXR29662.1 pirin family protein [Flavobacterium piscinae]